MDPTSATTILPLHAPTGGEVGLVTYLLRVLVYLLAFGLVGGLAHWCVRFLEDRTGSESSTDCNPE